MQLSVVFTGGTHEGTRLDLTLYGAVEVAGVRVLATKVEITLHKKVPAQWPTLEQSGAPAVPAVPVAPAAAPQEAPPRPRSKWDALQVDDEEPVSGEAELNAFFKKLYADADDDTRRAMVKSFQESNGTSLSTNWAEVGKKKVETRAPSGMEPRKYDA